MYEVKFECFILVKYLSKNCTDCRDSKSILFTFPTGCWDRTIFHRYLIKTQESKFSYNYTRKSSNVNKYSSTKASACTLTIIFSKCMMVLLLGLTQKGFPFYLKLLLLFNYKLPGPIIITPLKRGGGGLDRQHNCIWLNDTP